MSGWARVALAAAWGGAVLAAALAVWESGQGGLAALLLGLAALSTAVYASKRSGAWRYLLPGIATAAVFVVFPMVYTVALGFTNYSARNLLGFDEARQRLLAERLVAPGSERDLVLHADGARWRLLLPAQGGAPAWVSPPQDLGQPASGPVMLQPADSLPSGRAATPAELAALVPALRQRDWRAPDGQGWVLRSLSQMAPARQRYREAADGALIDTLSGARYQPDPAEGFYTSATGERLQPGYRVAVGWRHYARIVSDERFREPFASVFAWTVAFSALTVVGVTALGLLLAVLLNWPALAGRSVYRLVLFLPYAVPGFISILVFKGLFNQNLGEVNLILNALFGLKPAWFTDPLLARTMLLAVNIWLGFPYMMVLCSGLIQSIPSDLQEASAVLGAGPLTHFRRVTLPLILRPLTPLLISAFAFNFNNFVLVSLLTSGGPDRVDSALPVGSTDILVSYTWRIAFQDSGQQFGLAAAISTVIFVIVALITLVQMRFTRLNEEPRR